MSFQAGGDLCLGFFQAFWDEGLLPELPLGAHVLEIGCAEADWLAAMRTARPDLHLTGIDCRPDERKAADVRIQGDVLTHEFDTHSFDAIVAVSMLEWAGVGHYHDPKDPEGDVKVMQRAHGWLKPSGWFYFDVPYNPTPLERPRNQTMRVYTDADFERLFRKDWTVVRRKWFEGCMADGKVHPDGPYVAHVLKPR